MKTKKTLGLRGIVLMGLSGAIGFEIFVLMDYAYFNLAGPNVITAILLAGLINLLIMLSYCELGSAIPEVGGEYTYIKTAYGKYVAFIAGCFRWLASVFGAALAALSFVLQLAYFFSLIAPETQSFILSQASLIAAIVVIIYGSLEVRGIKQLGNAIVYALMVLFIGLIAGGLVNGMEQTSGISKPLLESFSGVFAATVYVFPMFFGMRALIAVAAAAKRPERDIPRGLLLSALLILPLYILLALVVVGAAPPEGTTLSVPLIGYAAEKTFGVAGGILFAVAGMAACLSGLGTALTVQSSISRGMSRDGYLPKILLAVHSRFGTYHIAVIAGTLFIMLLSAVGVVPFLGYAASFGSLLVFALVNLSLIRMRKTKPYLDRPFKTPLYPLTPILGVILSVALLIVPSFLGDANAAEALISAIGLTAIVMGTYYLRMAGRLRLQIAAGGIGIGTGISAAILAVAAETGSITPIFPFIPNYALLLIGIVISLGGFLNLTAGAKTKEKNATTTEQTVQDIESKL
ncbi:MAG: APC family permease [Candidatus Bathyarchaeota archaeon]|nr:APC family permease [Candidatus Bathyarchaeota archaeon]